MMNRAALIGACVLLAGCTGGGQDDLKAWMDEQAKTMRGAVRPLPELRQVPLVAYAGTQGDDPFRSGRMEPERRASGSALRPDLERRREPLEAFPLESLQMVGVLMQGNNTHALIKAGTVLHQVKVGNYMGQNFGVITQVTENEIKLRELVEDVYGDWVEKVSDLKLQERGEAGK
ncbi:pilus assembly protein PilP [Thauera sp.]|uniref:pilus assembly protein PilP n=1 Tax=Thauera sp. TaxID=1905334 RepID=UPI002B6B8A95|nr:pilus assembly protein PilP [Thauera sp.]HRO38154.1 pilus assembly protein PilP [Thauera sp.]